MLQFKCVKLNSKLDLSVWEKNQATGEFIGKAILELSPSFPNNPKGQPSAGDKRFDYSKKIKISFNMTDMLKCAYHLKVIAYGGTTEYKKFGDMSKVAGSESTEKKSLSIKSNDKGQAQVFLSSGKDNSVSIYLDGDESYALAKWFETVYQILAKNQEAKDEE